MSEEVPEVDYSDRLASNLQTFINAHKAELIVQSNALELDVDLLIMEYIVNGFNAVKSIAYQELEQKKRDYIIELAEVKAMIAAKKAVEEAKE